MNSCIACIITYVCVYVRELAFQRSFNKSMSSFGSTTFSARYLLDARLRTM